MATAEISKFAGILSAALSRHHLSGFEIAVPDSHKISRIQGLTLNINRKSLKEIILFVVVRLLGLKLGV